MANIFGTLAPKIIINGIEYQLPKTSRGGRMETFIKEVASWTDITVRREIHKREKGFRLQASYKYELLENDDFETLLTIFNKTNETDNIQLKFQTIPRGYPVYVDTDIQHNLADGFNAFDSAEISFTGKTLVPEFPNPDNIYTISLLRGKGIIIRTLNEQGA